MYQKHIPLILPLKALRIVRIIQLGDLIVKGKILRVGMFVRDEYFRAQSVKSSQREK